MRIFLLSAVLAVLLFDPGVRAAHQKMSANPIAQALIWQARQYTHIKTIHFLAIAHHIHTTTNGKTRTFKSRYEFWGAGIKYRIESFSPHAEIDNVVTDNVWVTQLWPARPRPKPRATRTNCMR